MMDSTKLEPGSRPARTGFRPRLPSFLKQPIPHGEKFTAVQASISAFKLKTVCEEAKCPNRTHCYGRGTLTFQILGDVCTRACGFCGEKFGRPPAPDPAEPRRVVEAARRLGLRHAVITSPARDDMEDDGAGAFAEVVRLFRSDLPNVTVEILTPDFRGRPECLAVVFDSRPHVFNHNIETVQRLTPKVRSKATYDRTLDVLRRASEYGLRTKSGFMVGHGETPEEIHETMTDLRRAGVELLTVGQYLPPSSHHLPLQKVYLPDEFNAIRQEALTLGFTDAATGPLVRSSFHAEEMVKTDLHEPGAWNQERP